MSSVAEGEAVGWVVDVVTCHSEAQAIHACASGNNIIIIKGSAIATSSVLDASTDSIHLVGARCKENGIGPGRKCCWAGGLQIDRNRIGVVKCGLIRRADRQSISTNERVSRIVD